MTKHLITVILMMIFIHEGKSQMRIFSLREAVDEALKNNGMVQAARYEWQSRKQLQKTSVDLPKAEVSLLYGQYNSYAKNDNNISATQSIPFSVFGSQRALNTALATSAESKELMTENEIVFRVKQAYYGLMYAKALNHLFLVQDSLFQGFERSAELRYKTGESNLLEASTAKSQRAESLIQVKQSNVDIQRHQWQLKALLQSKELPDVRGDSLTTFALDNVTDTAAYSNSPALAFYSQQIDVALSEKRVQSARMAPDLLIGFFTQTMIGTADPETGRVASATDRFSGFQVGLALPLWFGPHAAKVRAAESNRLAAQNNFEYQKQHMKAELEQVIQQIGTYKSSLAYYVESGLPNAELILRQSQIAFREGQIGYAEYLLGLRNSVNIRQSYLKTLNDYNQSVIYLEYLIGKK
jgi:heavy metal efflux system protein